MVTPNHQTGERVDTRSAPDDDATLSRVSAAVRTLLADGVWRAWQVGWSEVELVFDGVRNGWEAPRGDSIEGAVPGDGLRVSVRYRFRYRPLRWLFCQQLSRTETTADRIYVTIFKEYHPGGTRSIELELQYLLSDREWPSQLLRISHQWARLPQVMDTYARQAHQRLRERILWGDDAGVWIYSTGASLGPSEP
eukprot:ctg_178.g129